MSYYGETKPTFQTSILGTKYDIFMDVSKRDDPELALCDGYCDYSVKRIVVCNNEDSDLCDYDEHKKNSLRHELVHAYLFESGIGANVVWDVPGQTHPEHFVEWLAMQFPKLAETFKEVGAM